MTNSSVQKDFKLVLRWCSLSLTFTVPCTSGSEVYNKLCESLFLAEGNKAGITSTANELL